MLAGVPDYYQLDSQRKADQGKSAFETRNYQAARAFLTSTSFRGGTISAEIVTPHVLVEGPPCLRVACGNDGPYKAVRILFTQQAVEELNRSDSIRRLTGYF